MCTLGLLCVIIYMFATTFTHAVATHSGTENAEVLQEYYGTLIRSANTLFQTLSNGISWRSCAMALGEIHWVYVVIFALYVFFVNFAVLNVVTGIFCQSAIASAALDREEA